MQVLTAKEAKIHFGNLLDTVQREPVLITRNNRPTGVFVSLEDIQGTHIAEMLEQKVMGYDEWLYKKVSQSIENFENGTSKGSNFEEVHHNILDKLRTKLEINKK